VTGGSKYNRIHSAINRRKHAGTLHKLDIATLSPPSIRQAQKQITAE
jgi:hypothetical protein